MHDTVWNVPDDGGIESDKVRVIEEFEPVGIWSEDVGHFTNVKAVQKSWDTHGIVYETLFRRVLK